MTQYLEALTKSNAYLSRSGWLQIELIMERSKIQTFLERAEHPILFDGNDRHSLSQYQILSAFPDEIVSDPKDIGNRNFEESPLPDELKPVPFASGLAGYLSYDYGESVIIGEEAGREPESNTHSPNLPAVFYGYYSWSYCYDIRSEQGLLTFSPYCDQGIREKIAELILDTSQESNGAKTESGIELNWKKSSTQERYYQSYSKIKRYILEGDCYQTNLTQRFETTKTELKPPTLYFDLFGKSSSPYSAYFKINANQALLSFSPEQFIAINNKIITSKPIKGTAKITNSIGEDLSQTALAGSEKDKAENLMIVDLIRNDLSKVCEFGSVTAPKLFDIETHGHLNHMVSTVEGKLLPETNELDALLSCFPGGSITGAPKKRAMEIIRELEEHARSAYCGCVFYLSDDGSLNSNILIRTIVYDNQHYYCWAGGGIVHDSEAESEYIESLDKVSHLVGFTN